MCDSSSSSSQSFELHLDQFHVQIADLERRLVSVLSRAFGDCSSPSSAAKVPVYNHSRCRERGSGLI